MSLEPFRHAHSSDKEHQANNQEQEKEKFRNSRRGRGNPGKPKERSYQRDHQKNNSPTQHNNPPPFPDSGITAMLRARCGGASSCELGPSRTGGFGVAGAPPSTWDLRELEAGDFVNQFRPAKNEAGINL